MKEFSVFSLELGSEVANLTCGCCGKPFKSVCGFIKKNDWAYSTYFATLQSGHKEIRVGLTVSIGKWWDDSDEAVAQREWVYMHVWPSESGSGFEVRLEEPDSSRHADSQILGCKLQPEQARSHPLLDEFFAVSDFIIDNDPAVLSYLSGEEINIAGRVCPH
jgi:hypothetical protein